QSVVKHGGCAKNLREKDPQQLAEHVAQWQEIEKTQRMKNAFITAVARDVSFDWLEVGQKVSVREDHSARLGRGPRSEDDLNGAVAPERRRRKTGGGMCCHRGAQVFKADRGDAETVRRNIAADDGEPHTSLCCNTPRERWVRNRVHGHGHGS